MSCSRRRGPFALPLLLASALGALAAPVKLIWDTDFMSDCDDPGALGMLHALADNGEVEILATFSSGRFAYSPAAIDAVNTYYGRGHIPIATTKDPTAVSISGSYAQYLAQNFPHDTPTDNSVRDAVTAYRELLAGQADHSVVIVTVGYATNLKNLLASGPDVHSPLDGAALISAKMVKWVNMGGNFEDYENNDTNVNWTRDKVSAVTTIRNWPTEIVFNGREIGHLMRAGARLSQTPASNPVRAAYQQYFGGTAKDQHCADPSATLYAVRGLGHEGLQYWALDFGQIQINDDATFVWTSGATGPRTESRMVSARTWPEIGLMLLDDVDEIVEDLMIQAPLGAVADPPTAPTNGAATVDEGVPGQVTLVWTPSNVPHPAGWVAGYRVSRNGTFLDKALGTRFVDVVPASGNYTYSVVPYSAAGVAGQSLDLAAQVELPEEPPPPPPPPPPPAAGAPTPYATDADTLALYRFDETTGAIMNQAGNPALDLTDTGGPDGRKAGGGGYGAAAFDGFGSAFDVPKSGDGSYYSGTLANGDKGGLQTAAAVPQSSLQGADGAFTYEALVTLADASSEHEILAHDGGTSRGFLFRVVGGTLNFYNGGTSYTTPLPSSGDHAFAANEWFHAAVAYTGEANAAGNLVFYWTRLLHAGLRANALGTATLPADLSSAADVNKLGVGTTTRSPFRFQPTLVDEVRISRIARTAEALIARAEPPPFSGTAILLH